MSIALAAALVILAQQDKGRVSEYGANGFAVNAHVGKLSPIITLASKLQNITINLKKDEYETTTHYHDRLREAKDDWLEYGDAKMSATLACRIMVTASYNADTETMTSSVRFFRIDNKERMIIEPYWRERLSASREKELREEIKNLEWGLSNAGYKTAIGREISDRLQQEINQKSSDLDLAIKQRFLPEECLQVSNWKKLLNDRGRNVSTPKVFSVNIKMKINPLVARTLKPDLAAACVFELDSSCWKKNGPPSFLESIDTRDDQVPSLTCIKVRAKALVIYDQKSGTIHGSQIVAST